MLKTERSLSDQVNEIIGDRAGGLSRRSVERLGELLESGQSSAGLRELRNVREQIFSAAQAQHEEAGLFSPRLHLNDHVIAIHRKVRDAEALEQGLAESRFPAARSGATGGLEGICGVVLQNAEEVDFRRLIEAVDAELPKLIVEPDRAAEMRDLLLDCAVHRNEHRRVIVGD